MIRPDPVPERCRGPGRPYGIERRTRRRDRYVRPTRSHRRDSAARRGTGRTGSPLTRGIGGTGGAINDPRAGRVGPAVAAAAAPRAAAPRPSPDATGACASRCRPLPDGPGGRAGRRHLGPGPRLPFPDPTPDRPRVLAWRPIRRGSGRSVGRAAARGRRAGTETVSAPCGRRASIVAAATLDPCRADRIRGRRG